MNDNVGAGNKVVNHGGQTKLPRCVHNTYPEELLRHAHAYVYNTWRGGFQKISYHISVGSETFSANRFNIRRLLT